MVLLALLTVGLSAILDNVTKGLLMAPVTLVITKRPELSSIKFLVTEALASHIGSTATLVGDPLNIMSASKTELGFLDFLLVTGPNASLIMRVRRTGGDPSWCRITRGQRVGIGGKRRTNSSSLLFLSLPRPYCEARCMIPLACLTVSG